MNGKNELMLSPGNHDSTGEKIATGLGWFSIALGALELLNPRPLARSLGMEESETLLQLYGAREIATGIGILLAQDPTPWIWGRVVGDALDIGALAAHFTPRNSEAENVAIALGNVAAVTALDVYCALKLSSHSAGQIRRDYSDRSGLPSSPEVMRGAASDFEVPADMRTPEALRPYPAPASDAPAKKRAPRKAADRNRPTPSYRRAPRQ